MRDGRINPLQESLLKRSSWVTMAFGGRGPKLTTAEREAVARFRERRVAGDAPATLTHRAPHIPVEVHVVRSESSPRDLRATRELKAQREAARVRRARERKFADPIETANAPSCGLSSFMGRVRPEASTGSRPTSPNRAEEEAAGGESVRARLGELRSRFKLYMEKDAQMQIGSRETLSLSKGLGFAVRRPSMFKGRRKAGDPNDSVNEQDSDDYEQQRKDDAYFHDLLVKEST